MLLYILSRSVIAQRLGLSIIRVGIGLIFMVHGYSKLMAGTGTWEWLGGAMGVFGITSAPVFWGFIAAATEFFGGLSLVLGFGTRVAAFFMACGMFVALSMHLAKGDAFQVYSYPLSMIVVFIGLMVAGGGDYALEVLIGE